MIYLLEATRRRWSKLVISDLLIFVHGKYSTRKRIGQCDFGAFRKALSRMISETAKRPTGASVADRFLFEDIAGVKAVFFTLEEAFDVGFVAEE